MEGMMNRKQVEQVVSAYIDRLRDAMQELQATWATRFDDAVAAGDLDAPAAAACKASLATGVDEAIAEVSEFARVETARLFSKGASDAN